MAIILDIETRSRCDLKARGTWAYAADPSTQILCCAWLDDEERIGGVWRQGQPIPAWVQSNKILVAHNAMFEYAVFSYQPHWDRTAIRRWRCTATMARAVGFPGTLARTADILGCAQQKDSRGKALIAALCVPQADGSFNADEALMGELIKYCKQDVRTTRELWQKLPELSERELEVFHIDMRANVRGVRIDLDMVHAALEIYESYKRRVVDQFVAHYGIKPTQRARVLELINSKLENPIRNTQAANLAHELLRSDLSPEVRYIMNTVRDAGRSAVAKYQKLRDYVCPDGIWRSPIVMYGAHGTGRWSSYGPQYHNFPRRRLYTDDGEAVARNIKANTLPDNVAESKYLADALTATIIARPGRRFIKADYSAVEARILGALAGAREYNDVYVRGGDLYIDMASRIFKKPVQKGSWERHMGKAAILGLGYGMGDVTFARLILSYGIEITGDALNTILGDERMAYLDALQERLESDSDYRRRARQTFDDVGLNLDNYMLLVAAAGYVVHIYRDAYPAIPELWKSMGDAFRRVMRIRGSAAGCSDITFIGRGGAAVIMVLPSGRPIYYWRPRELREIPDLDDSARRKSSHGAELDSSPDEIRYLRHVSTHSYWERTYGAKLVENAVQAISRDALADCYIAAHKLPGAEVVLSSHDEITIEADSRATNELFNKYLSEKYRSAWSRKFPLELDISSSTRLLCKGGATVEAPQS